MPDQLLISVLQTVQAKLPGLGSGSCSLVATYHMAQFGHSNRSLVRVPLVIAGICAPESQFSIP